MKQQYGLEGIPQGPETKIFRQSGSSIRGFMPFCIEHEHEVATIGRIDSVSFNKFIRKGFISGYHSAEKNLFLLSGKKDDILDFCAYTAKVPEMVINTIEIDMRALQEKLPEVTLAWFRFQKGMIRASALMGANIQKTDAFVQAKAEGDISTLSFHIADGEGVAHPVMVTNDGAVVLQSPYVNTDQEIEIVLEVKALLLDGIYREVPVKVTRRAAAAV